MNATTVIAFVALLFAMTGGAFAVSGHGGGGAHATVAKKKSKTGPRGPAGPRGQAGPAGPTGPAGPAGAKGETGAAGAKGEAGVSGTAGTDGKDGENVSIVKLQPGEGGCAEGGAKFSGGGKEATACNGEKGEPGESGSAGSFPEKLPEGATETGLSHVHFASENETSSLSISFPIPLPLPISEKNVHFVSVAEQSGKTGPSQCSGNPEKPTAAKGNFCIYEAGPGSEGQSKFSVGPVNSPGSGEFHVETTGVAGAVAFVSVEKGEPSSDLFMVWAVSAA